MLILWILLLLLLLLLSLPLILMHLSNILMTTRLLVYRNKFEFGTSNGRASSKEDLYISQVNLVMRKVRSFLKNGEMQPIMLI